MRLSHRRLFPGEGVVVEFARRNATFAIPASCAVPRQAIDLNCPARQACLPPARTDRLLAAARKKLGVGGEPVCLTDDAVQRPARLPMSVDLCSGRSSTFSFQTPPRHCQQAWCIKMKCRTVERVTTDVKAGMRPSTAVAHGGNSQEGDGQGGLRRQGRWAEAEALGRRRRPLIERANSDDGEDNKEKVCLVQSFSHSHQSRARARVSPISSTWHST